MDTVHTLGLLQDVMVTFPRKHIQKSCTAILRVMTVRKAVRIMMPCFCCWFFAYIKIWQFVTWSVCYSVGRFTLAFSWKVCKWKGARGFVVRHFLRFVLVKFSFVLAFKSLAYFKVMFHICWHSSELLMCIIEGYSTSQIHLLLCVTCYQGDGYRGDVIGFYVQSLCWNRDVCMYLCGLFSQRWLQRGCDRSLCSVCAGFAIYVYICMACFAGGDVIGYCVQSVCWVCCVFVWFVLQEVVAEGVWLVTVQCLLCAVCMLGLLCICVVYSPGGGCRGGVVGHGLVVTVCSLYAGFVVYLCGLFSRRWLQRGCGWSQFSGYCVQSVCWVCCVFVWPILQEVVTEGGVTGHSSVVTACSLDAGFVVYVCICVAYSPGGGYRGVC